MPAINLPNINITEEGLNNKKTMENILDTLQKYRKELNFLLMNLDEDNMPSVIGRIEDGEGRISLINQAIDEIQLLVADNTGDIAQLTVRADEIAATVANNAGDIAQLQITANSIQTTVANHAGEISTIKQTAQGIQTQVTSINNTVGSHSSQITQLSNSISSKVSYTDYNGVQIASLINQEAGRITLSAAVLDLRGITTIYSPYNPYSYTVMSGQGISIVAGLGGPSYVFPITWDTYISFELGRGVNTVFPDVVNFDSAVGFNYYTGFSGVVDFSGASVIGLDVGGNSEYAIECYYRDNKCYIDLNHATGILTIRNKNGQVIGYVTPD